MRPILEFCDCESESCLCEKGKCKCGKELPPIDFPKEEDLDRIDARVGGSWTWKKPKPRCLSGETWDDTVQACKTNEATTSSGVATTDTRFYGATWEGNFFLQKPAIGAWENEGHKNGFWKDIDILGYGYTYYQVDPKAIKGLNGRVIGKIEKRADIIATQSPKGAYDKHLKSLSKKHNIGI